MAAARPAAAAQRTGDVEKADGAAHRAGDVEKADGLSRRAR